MPLLLPQPKFRELNNLGTGPLIGGTVETFEAGTSTPIATFTDSTGTGANPWPVVLDSQGRADIWIAENTPVKVVVKDSTGATIYTADNVTGVGSGSGSPTPTTAQEWLVQPETPSFVSATSYSIPGDVSALHHIGRRVRAQVSAGVTYHTITNVIFATGTTTVTVANDSTPLDAGLSVVSLGLLSADNPSVSVDGVAGIGTLTTIQSGMVVMTGRTTPDTGYVWCDGALYDGANATYAALYAAIGTTFNTGGETGDEFRVPNLNGRSPMGFGQGNTAEGGGAGTARSLGGLHGAETHTLTIPEMPNHGHTLNQQDPGVASNAVAGKGDGNNPTSSPVPIQTTGGDAPHNNVSPAIVLGFQIKL